MITSGGRFGDMFMLLWCQRRHRPGSKWLRVACCEACIAGVGISVPHPQVLQPYIGTCWCMCSSKGTAGFLLQGLFSRVRCHWMLVLDLWCFVDMNQPAHSML